ncbi:uncharacterized protein P174DRAFT_260603 [Aspergillus novofumigatus IBT 16806]|uniref:Uncharacterized protein n=1 Tax=Aspergillus novofumigatus (strain IBT 16806) TaxID=1392255 RepID=A0A2I1C3A0_ASPN1|nr:uncharacterized protein P174DRAFT_260603 [Aspergillus novofumigatus IBT 16806]PKX92117.1 hypothetical protein P174DRAFT_260603 [Aspergillus novofumigatus IBT 16806]
MARDDGSHVNNDRPSIVPAGGTREPIYAYVSEVSYACSHASTIFEGAAVFRRRSIICAVSTSDVLMPEFSLRTSMLDRLLAFGSEATLSYVLCMYLSQLYLIYSTFLGS